jgi:flavin reductase (DIM6/NTAB) family NADH-FMN oxidoreductase RutF
MGGQGDGALGPVDESTYRLAMRHHPGGVAVVTAAGPDGPVGFTVTSLTAASLDPPLVSFYLGTGSRSLPILRSGRHFGVNLLGALQADLAARFAHRDVERFAPPTRWHPGPHAVPMLDGATLHMVCGLAEVRPVGDHYLVVGAVHAVERGAPDEPLLYAHGAFGRLVPVEPRLPGGQATRPMSEVSPYHRSNASGASGRDR